MVKIVFSCLVVSILFMFGCAGNKKKPATMMKTDTIAKAIVTNEDLSSAATAYNSVNMHLDLYDKNITFYGTNSDWEIFIQSDSILLFKSDSDTLRFLISKKSQTQDVAVVRYYSKKELTLHDTVRSKKQITLSIFEGPFLDEASSTYYPFSVRVSINDPLDKQLAYYSGGGFYLGNPRIHDIWVLDSLNKVKVSATDYPNGFPTLEFHLDGGKIHGFAGCNDFSSSFYFIQNQIQFSSTASTLKICMQMTGETSFLSLISNKKYAYYFLTNRLKLKHADGTEVVLKKVD